MTSDVASFGTAPTYIVELLKTSFSIAAVTSPSGDIKEKAYAAVQLIS